MAPLALQVLPLALGAAVSPMALTLELLILSGRTKPRLRGWAYFLGAAVTIFIFGLLAATLLGGVNLTSNGSLDPVSMTLHLILGMVLAALGVRELIPKKTLGAAHKNRVAAKLSNAKTPYFFVVGVVAILTNFSTLVLYLPAVHLIVKSPEPVDIKLWIGFMLWAVTLLPILLPVLAVTVTGHRSDALLAQVNGWTTRHSKQINAGICFLFAVLVAWPALSQIIG